MPFIVLTAIVQIGLIIHVVRTGRPSFWVFVILFVPGIGSVAYCIVELLPELSNNLMARRAMRGVKKTFNPGGELRRRQLEHRLSGSVDAARHLASELMDSGRYAEAVDHYRSALTGLYEHDPDLMLGLSKAQFGNGDAEACKRTLKLLNEKNPEHRSADGHLLYARALEQGGDLAAAEEEYAAVSVYYSGAEARVRYAQLLEKRQKTDAARAEYADILTSAELAPRHFRKAQKKWLAESKAALARLR